jgi:hypothetical protein
MNKFRALFIALILGVVVGIGGCATPHSGPVKSDPQDKPSDILDKVFKKNDESDDMERLD